MRRGRALRRVAPLLLAAWPALAEPPDGEWIVFSPEGGQFRIEIPGEPRPETDSRLTPVGSVQERKWWLETGAMELAVETHDVPRLGAAIAPEDVILDRSTRGVVASKNGELIESRPILVQDAPGREFRYALAGPEGAGGRLAVARTILVGRRIYLLTAAAARDPRADADVQRFFDSFRFWR